MGAGVAKTRSTRILRTTLRFRSAFASAGLATFLCAPAAAQDSADQDVTPNDTTAERFARNFEAYGIKTGGFTVFPAATFAQIYDDNIFSLSSAPIDDYIADLSGSLRIASNWSRHGLEFVADVRRLQFYENDEESTTDYGVAGRATLDVGARNSASLYAAHRQATEARRSTQTVFGSAAPVRFSTTSAAADFDFVQTRFREQFGAALVEADYDDADLVGGGVADQDFRDQTSYTAYYRQSYRIRPTIAAFAEIRGAIHEFDAPQPGLGVVQDSKSWRALGGVAVDINKVARGEIGVGYQKRDFDDPLFSDIEGFNADVELAYYISDLTTVIVSAERAIEDTAVIGVAGAVSTGGQIEVQHELFRPLLVTARFEYEEDDFRGLDRVDRVTAASVGLNYAFRRSIGVSLRYTWLDVESQGLASRNSFTENVVRLGLELRR